MRIKSFLSHRDFRWSLFIPQGLPLVAFYFLFFTCHLRALPDLTVSQISFSDDSPSKNQVITISANITNNGDNYFNQVVLTPATSSYQICASSTPVAISTATWLAQMFNLPSDLYLGKISLHMRSRNPEQATTHYIRVEIRDTVMDYYGIEPTPLSIPPLATETLNNITTFYQWYDFAFGTELYLAKETTYWICVETLEGGASGYALWNSTYVAVDMVAGGNGVAWSSMESVSGKREIHFNAYESKETVVNFFDGDPANGGVIISTSIIKKPISSGSEVVVSTAWITTGGNHSIYAVADYLSLIDEGNENNNSLYKNLNVENQPSIVSVFPPENALGIDTSTSVYVYFSEDMNEISTGAVSVRAIRNNESNTVNSEITGSKEYVGSDKKLVFTSDNFKNNYIYEVTVSAGACDIYGNNLKSSKRWTFSTILDPTVSNIIKDPVNPGLYELIVSPNAFPEKVYIVGSTATSKSSEVEQANAKLQKFGDSFHFFLSGSLREFFAYNASGELVTDNFSSQVTVTVPYSETDGIINNTSPPVREKTLSIYYLNEKNNLWVRLPDSTVNTQAKTVTATVPHFFVFAVLGTSSFDLSNAYAFPVPFKPNSALGHTNITFINLSSVATIRIYTISGELAEKLEEIDGDGQYIWAEANKLASGIYIYHIENEKEKKFGKLVVIK